ncbi:tubulin alpha chain [Aspergillus lucknowensis]|uniref:Tubulin alpha-B chain n=1 Tax=Aspergillus lucknowensis TaxID=176173 RepID=A0ABR4LCM8_9EURO
MREMISLNVGQAGCQIANAYWELYCLEHGIGLYGYLTKEQKATPLNRAPSSVFSETNLGKCVPRTIYADLASDVIDEVRTGPYRDLFDPEQMISGKEDASGNYARGYHALGSKMIDQVMDRIGRAVDDCANFQGFLLFHSLGEGTGSGFGALLMDRLAEKYGKKTKLEFCVNSSPRTATSAIELYNAVLTTHATLEASDCSFIADNEAVSEICRNKLGIELPSHGNLNHLIAQVVSSVTTSLRFDGRLNGYLEQFQTMNPYPRLHFPVVAYSPVCSTTTLSDGSSRIHEITMSCFQSGNQMVRCGPCSGKYMCPCLPNRGDTGRPFNFSVRHQPAATVPDSSLGKSPRAVAVVDTWSTISHNFDGTFSKRAFVHWLERECLGWDALCEAREDIAGLEAEYKEFAGEDTVGDRSAMMRSLSNGGIQ